MAKVLGVCGSKQSGKNSFCNFVKELLPGCNVKEFAFAHSLKTLATDGFMIPKKSCYGSDSDKNYPIATWGKYFSDEILSKYKKQRDDLLSGREFLQILGTDIIRGNKMKAMSEIAFELVIKQWLSEELGIIWEKGEPKEPYNFQDVWTDIVLADIRKGYHSFDVITISDVRFLNEINALKKVNAKLIRLHRNTNKANSIPHPSELEMLQMDDEMFDYVLEEENNKNLLQLKKFTISVLMNEQLIGFGGIAL